MKKNIFSVEVVVDFEIRGVEFVKGDKVFLIPQEDPEIKDLFQEIFMRHSKKIRPHRSLREKISRGGRGGFYVSADGLACLAEAGVSFFEEQVEHYLPHNLIRGQMSGSVGIVGPRGSFLPAEEAVKEIIKYGRFGGWIKAAVDLPAIRRMIKKTQSRKGINSIHTYCSLWKIFLKFPSPGKLEKNLWKVKRRAELILSAYKGQFSPAWRDITNALLADERPNRAAVIAVAATLGMNLWKDECVMVSFREAVLWLEEHRMALYPVVSGGLRHRAEPEITTPDGEVYAGIEIDRFGKRSKIWVVRKGDLTFTKTQDYPPQRVLQDANEEWGVLEMADSVVVTSVRLADSHPYDGSYYYYRYEVCLDMAGKAGRFSVAESYHDNRESHYAVGANGSNMLCGEDDAQQLFKMFEGGGGDGAETIRLLGPTNETMKAIFHGVDNPEIKITSKSRGCGVVDYWYEGREGVLFFRDRGHTGHSASDSSWYSRGSGGQVCKHLTEEERIAMVS